jgi:hypothetical protein
VTRILERKAALLERKAAKNDSATLRNATPHPEDHKPGESQQKIVADLIWSDISAKDASNPPKISIEKAARVVAEKPRIIKDAENTDGGGDNSRENQRR